LEKIVLQGTPGKGPLKKFQAMAQKIGQCSADAKGVKQGLDPQKKRLDTTRWGEIRERKFNLIGSLVLRENEENTGKRRPSKALMGEETRLL